ncbi:MAG: post-COAP-1 domain-containing protein, partial [Chthoniobacterales bacterium]
NWTVTGSLHTGREAHTATLLSDGRVLVAGGFGTSYNTLASAELYDPATGNWTYTGTLNTGREWHTSTFFTDGEVLVAGGFGYGGSLASAELYDPATGNWTVTGSLNTGRWWHTATLLSDGRVLVAGGEHISYGPSLASAELYDPGIAAATHVDGRGALDNQGNEVTFMFRASQGNESGKLGLFEFCDPAAAVRMTNAKIRSLSIAGNTADFSGQAYLENGSRVTFNVNVTDNGEPGTLDTISISLSSGYSVSGALTSGDIHIY